MIEPSGPLMKDGPVVDHGLVPPKFVKTAEPWVQNVAAKFPNGFQLTVAIPGFMAKRGKHTYFLTSYVYDQIEKIYYTFLPYKDHKTLQPFDYLILMKKNKTGLALDMKSVREDAVYKNAFLYGFEKHLFTKLTKEDLGYE